MTNVSPQIQTDADAIRKRYETLLSLYNKEFVIGLGNEFSDVIYLSKELLHCAVNAYFDDICKYKAYAGSEFADRHKQAAYTMLWLARFKPIQIVEGTKINHTLLTINEAFAIFASLMFLNPSVMNGMTEAFYNHLIYSLIYREIGGRPLATILYLMEKASEHDIKY